MPTAAELDDMNVGVPQPRAFKTRENDLRQPNLTQTCLKTYKFAKNERKFMKTLQQARGTS